MSLRGSSLGLLGAPPPTPTIKPNRTLGKLRSKSLAAVAAALIPVVPEGRQARTTLCPPICPKVYYRYLYRSQPVEGLDALHLTLLGTLLVQPVGRRSIP